MKVDSEAKFQGLQLLQNELFMFVLAKLRNIEICSAKIPIIPATRLKGTD